MAGHQLHWRLALLFGVAALPAVITVAFALFVVDHCFADGLPIIPTAVTARQVADAGFEEHASSIRSEERSLTM